MRRIIILLVLFICFGAVPCFARLNVVATLPWIGSIARDIGTDRIDVTLLVKPNQDPHQIEAKPSMILAVRKADMVMYNGLDLEIGYLPILIESSRNQRVQPGKPGNFDCSRFVLAIEKPVTVDRSLGDVHPLGNPHYHLSPKNIRRVVRGMIQGLAEADPGSAAHYRSQGALFLARFDEKMKEWARRPLQGRSFVAYHKFFEYLAMEYGFEVSGYIEAKPGIPPSAGHDEELIRMMRKRRFDGILVTAYSPRAASDFLSRKAGVKVIVVPHEVGCVPAAKDWFSLMDLVFSELSS